MCVDAIDDQFVPQRWTAKSSLSSYLAMSNSKSDRDAHREATVPRLVSNRCNLCLDLNTDSNGLNIDRNFLFPQLPLFDSIWTRALV